VASALEDYSGADKQERSVRKRLKTFFILSLRTEEEHEIANEERLKTTGEVKPSVSRDLPGRYKRFAFI